MASVAVTTVANDSHIPPRPSPFSREKKHRPVVHLPTRPGEEGQEGTAGPVTNGTAAEEEEGKMTEGWCDSIPFFFLLLPSGVATADFQSPFAPIFCILFHHFNHCHVLSRLIDTPPFRPSPFPPTWQFYPQYPSPIMSCLLCFLSNCD